MSSSQSCNNNSTSELKSSDSEDFRGFNSDEKKEAEASVSNILENNPNCNCCGELKTPDHSKFICKICCLGFEQVEDMTRHLIQHHNGGDYFQKNIGSTQATPATASESIGRNVMGRF